ncbi:hypothetical protein BU16DRAFT_562237 [Lophium mytilinum]|uniref:Uncharacterized protein n=1 Tax=Lophium mytilinum TaxID=390894 RepID=A0A6A6QQ91_9PEZI|nr:hypothetical protein BU16DRAFT_562237 [Lophium mytilinum]
MEERFQGPRERVSSLENGKAKDRSGEMMPPPPLPTSGSHPKRIPHQLVAFRRRSPQSSVGTHSRQLLESSDQDINLDDDPEDATKDLKLPDVGAQSNTTQRYRPGAFGRPLGQWVEKKAVTTSASSRRDNSHQYPSQLNTWRSQASNLGQPSNTPAANANANGTPLTTPSTTTQGKRKWDQPSSILVNWLRKAVASGDWDGNLVDEFLHQRPKIARVRGSGRGVPQPISLEALKVAKIILHDDVTALVDPDIKSGDPIRVDTPSGPRSAKRRNSIIMEYKSEKVAVCVRITTHGERGISFIRPQFRSNHLGIRLANDATYVNHANGPELLANATAGFKLSPNSYVILECFDYHVKGNEFINGELCPDSFAELTKELTKKGQL